MATPNIFLLASDNSPKLLPLLRENPSLASSQDKHGYSLVHAAASYSHLDLLRLLIAEFHADPNLRDEDGETALFVVETVDAAQVLVEEIKIDVQVKNDEGQTAEEKIRTEGEFPTVADYLQTVRAQNVVDPADVIVDRPPPLPKGITMNLATVEQTGDEGEVDPEFKRRIDELAQREDFHGEQAQSELRDLIRDAVSGVGVGGAGEGRDVRRRVD
jgi:hypothetical protein